MTIINVLILSAIRQNLMSIEARFCVDRSHDMFGTYFAHRILTTPTDTWLLSLAIIVMFAFE